MAKNGNEHEPRGRYQVWHREADGFVPVATVRAGNRLAALVLTMNRTDADWSENEPVTALLPNVRSSDVGDVIVNPKGVAYQVTTTRLGLAFERIDFPPYREQQALFAEWEQDYAAALLRDRKAAFGQILGRPISTPGPGTTKPEPSRNRDDGIER